MAKVEVRTAERPGWYIGFDNERKPMVVVEIWINGHRFVSDVFLIELDAELFSGGKHFCAEGASGFYVEGKHKDWSKG